MAFLSALLAQNAGAADQRGANYKDALAGTARLQDLTLRQNEDAAQAAQSQREFDRLSKNDAFEQQRQTNHDKDAQQQRDKLAGNGLSVPAGIVPLNHGKAVSPQQKISDLYSVASFYRGKGAFDKADEYEQAANDLEKGLNNQQRTALGQQKENALESWRVQTIQQKTAMFNSRQQQQFTEFTRDAELKTSAIEQRGQIAVLNDKERTYVAQLTALGMMQGKTAELAMRSAIASFQGEVSAHNADVRSNVPGVAAGAVDPVFTPPSITLNLNGVSQPIPPTNGAFPLVQGANGSAPIPPSPNGSAPAAAAQSNGGGLNGIYGRKPAPQAPAMKTFTPNPYSASAVQPDPAVDGLVATTVKEWPLLQKKGVTISSLTTMFKQHMGAKYTDAQIATAVAKIAAQLGQPQPIVGPTEVRGPANPFPQLTP